MDDIYYYSICTLYKHAYMLEKLNANGIDSGSFLLKLFIQQLMCSHNKKRTAYKSSTYVRIIVLKLTVQKKRTYAQLLHTRTHTELEIDSVTLLTFILRQGSQLIKDL